MSLVVSTCLHIRHVQCIELGVDGWLWVDASVIVMARGSGGMVIVVDLVRGVTEGSVGASSVS